MSKDKIKCPVCGQEVEPEITICPSCSFEIHILPSDLPAEIEELEKRRVEYGKKVLLSIKEENQRLSEEIANKPQEILDAKKPLEEKVVKLENDLAKSRSNTKEQKVLLKQCQAELNKAMDSLSKSQTQVDEKLEELSKVQKALSDTQDLLAKEKKDKKNLSSKLKDLEDKLSNQTAQSSNAIAYLVIRKGDNLTEILDIHEGESSFGYKNSSGSHHQVLYGKLEDVHFAIKANAVINERGNVRTTVKCFPKEGQVYMDEKETVPVVSGAVMNKNETIYAGGIGFTLVSKSKNKA